MEEKLVTRISVLSMLLGGGKTTERLLVRISIETHKTSPDFDQTAADKAKNRIKQALGEFVLPPSGHLATASDACSFR
jgi:hypothetical protein